MFDRAVNGQPVIAQTGLVFSGFVAIIAVKQLQAEIQLGQCADDTQAGYAQLGAGGFLVCCRRGRERYAGNATGLCYGRSRCGCSVAVATNLGLLESKSRRAEQDHQSCDENYSDRRHFTLPRIGRNPPCLLKIALLTVKMAPLVLKRNHLPYVVKPL